ncbi:MAG: D-aminoacyl-tRNA deacylase involved in ethanol tolerance GEK1 [Candidatus Methanohalarchaeum thermophilum]|uniref:D-aminoacyl-tRNA deacylase n=1 Tax=Methanohalarchaeum thermophilum TaxID=1903181 RepID=A0A1Q6DTB0_METT1|nr:MAG: D-aminoacyl-tRNA deacylase involved in ethanol tolerance GEK1 [Candidatus Methanohalarchaeum thermophilum]
MENESEKILIIISKQDPASLNIRDRLVEMCDWRERESEELGSFLSFKNFRLKSIDELHVENNDLDSRFKDFGASYFVFPTRHSSESGKRILSLHSTGNPSEEAELGGESCSFSMSAPRLMKDAIVKLRNFGRELDYDVTLEATHHGPTDIDTPSFFIEIGSEEEEWKDKEAGRVIANTILSLKPRNPIVGVSLGGGHYVPRQTRLSLETNVVFGHIIPDYSFSEPDSIVKAIDKTPGCSFIHLNDEVKNMQLREKLEELDLPKYSESEIRDLDPLNMDIRERIYDFSDIDLEPVFYGGRDYDSFTSTSFNQEFVDKVQNTDRNKFISNLKDNNALVFKKENGSFSNEMLFPSEDFLNLATGFVDDCISILEDDSDLEVIQKEDKIVIEIYNKKFDPEKAKSFGLEEREFGRLANGEKVEKGGNTITPEMVHSINKNKIDLNNPPDQLDRIKIN